MVVSQSIFKDAIPLGSGFPAAFRGVNEMLMLVWYYHVAPTKRRVKPMERCFECKRTMGELVHTFPAKVTLADQVIDERN